MEVVVAAGGVVVAVATTGAKGSVQGNRQVSVTGCGLRMVAAGNAGNSWCRWFLL